MDARAYWIWMQLGVGVAAAVQEALCVYADARELYEAGPAHWRQSGALTNRQIRGLCDASLDTAQEKLRQCDKNGWRVLTPDSPAYPQRLLELRDLPVVLYASGEPECLHERLGIAVVGTRTASETSRRVASQLCREITRAGAVVVSGGALGIDSAAHEGALSAGGKTVAVLGCGLGTPYLLTNEPLRVRIAKQGALITEFAPFAPVTAHNFPLRNRIISGICYGTLVIEAGGRSGSLITAGFALEQGRDVLAVPGDITNSAYTGANTLIREGAKPVFSAYDVLEDYAYQFPDTLSLQAVPQQLTPTGSAPRAKSKPAQPAEPPAPQTDIALPKPDLAKGISEKARRVYAAMGETPVGADELAQAAQLAMGDVLAALTELEIFGAIAPLPGKRYGIKR